MTPTRCLMVLMVCLMITTLPVPASGLFPTPRVPLSRSPRLPTTETPAITPHATLSDSSDSHERMQERAPDRAPVPINFDDLGSRLYAPGEVAAAGERDASGSGSGSTSNHLVFDVSSSLDEILNYFANATALPAPPAMLHDATENTTSTNSTSSSANGYSADDVIVPTPFEESIFDQDSAAADKHVVPSPTTSTTKPQPQPAIKSAAIISKVCDTAFFAITLFVLALQ